MDPVVLLLPSSLLLLLLSAAALVAADAIVFEPDTEDGDRYRLPDGFLLGAGSSAYQSEGAWNVNGKGVNVFDHYYNFEAGHDDEFYRNGNVAVDGYNHIDDDIEMMKKLKFRLYRFSLSWSRILPDGNATNINPDGIRYYNELINKLKANDIEPMVTIYHFDHPYALHEKYGSWKSKEMIDPFVAFATLAFEQFGDRVKYWTTFNEPNAYCSLVYAKGDMPPGKEVNTEDYISCMHNQLLAHGRTYRLYKEQYASTQQGKIGMSYLSDIGSPNSTSPSTAEIAEAECVNMFMFGFIGHAVVFGDYPDIVKQIYAIVKAGQVIKAVPTFTEDEKKMMNNSVDFLAMNVYYTFDMADATRMMCNTLSGSASSAALNSAVLNSAALSSAVLSSAALSARESASHPFEPHVFSNTDPPAIQNSIKFAKTHFNVPIFISENGYEDMDPLVGIHDQPRAVYHSAYIRAMLETINETNADVFGMAVWSLLDDMEWSRANNSKMGLVHVDFSSPLRTRTLKDSSAFFIKVGTDGKVPLVKPIDETTLQPQFTTAAASVVPPTQTPLTSASESAETCHLLLVCFLIAMAAL